MARDLRNLVFVITGAGSGIGAATARAAAEAGMDLVLNGRRAEPLEAVARDIRARGRRVEIVTGDIAQPGTNTALLDATEARLGRFDVVFSNAGYGLNKTTVDLSSDELRRIFEVNFFASVELLQLAARRLLAAQRGGHLLMCSSAVAKFTLPTFGAYSATKAAQNHICRAMRVELRKTGIEVSSVHPVTTRTEFFTTAAQHSAGGPRLDIRERMMQPPEKVARAIIRCLRHPRPEVWTSFGARFLAGVGTIFPRLFDRIGALAEPK